MKKLIQLLALSGVFYLFVFTLQGQPKTFNKLIGGVFFKYPSAVEVDDTGNLYAATLNGIVKISPTGTLLLHFGSPGSEDGQFTSLSGIAVDKEGNIYVSDVIANRIQKFDPQGKFLWKLGSKGSKDGQFDLLKNITVDNQGNLYAVDRANSRIQKFDPSGKFLMKFGSHGFTDGTFNALSHITLDANKNIYVTDNSLIQKFDSTGRFLMKFGGYGSSDGKLDYPQGITLDRQGNIYVMDSNNYRVQKFSPTGVFLAKFGMWGPGNGGFYSPVDIVTDKQDNVYVTDATRIQKFDSQGKFLVRFGAKGSNEGQFSNPQEINVDTQGNIWIADNTVYKFNYKGDLLIKFGSFGLNDVGFGVIGGIATDRLGNVYIAETSKDRIQKLDSKGKFLFSFSIKIDDQYTNPVGLVVGDNGNIYVAEAVSRTIRIFNSQGDFISKFGSYGTGEAQFTSLAAITLDTQGYLYTADAGNKCIQKFDRSGKLLLKFGTSGNADGQFSSLSGVAVDNQGNIYTSETDRGYTQKFNANGIFLSKIDTYSSSSIALGRYGNIYSLSEIGIVEYGERSVKPHITGIIFSDDNQNCVFDPTEMPLSDVVVVAEPGHYYGITDTAGNYEIAIDTGKYRVSQVLDTTLIRSIQPICPSGNTSSIIDIKSGGQLITGIDFADKVFLFPILSVQLHSNRRRRCFLNTTMVSYMNTGYAEAQNVKVYVRMPTSVVLKSANKSYIIDKDSNYVFTIGTLKPNQSGTIQIKDSVVCERGITGLTVCTKAWITPANSYSLPSNPPWDKSELTLKGQCIENGRVRLTVKNTGQGHMSDSTEFRILLDAQLALRHKLKLAKGDSLVLRIPANGKTVRLEVDQRPGHPRKSQSNLTLEGCVASVNDVISKGFVDVLPQDDAELEVSVDCQAIIDSYDPNDKQVSPIGTTDQHFTPTTSELKYLIRFQNTGTDTAYTVVIIDTLSEHLDISTLQQGAASHVYGLHVRGKGRPILEWTFRNINLPDSTRNQLASNGFVSFSIKPKTGLAEKTLIENYADIYFDYNDPIRTNTTFNILYDVPKEIVSFVRLNVIEVIETVTTPEASIGIDELLRLQPNPTTGKVVLNLLDNSLLIEQIVVYNTVGQQVKKHWFSGLTSPVELDLTGQSAGMYLIHIGTSKGRITRKIIVE